MPWFERLIPPRRTGRIAALRALQFVGAAVIGGGVLAVLMHWSGTVSDVLSLAVGAAGALAVASVIWMRGGYTFSEQTRHAESGWSALHAEVARSRRHGRQFAIIGIPDRVWAPVSMTASERTTLGVSAALSVHRLLRIPDRAWLDGSLLHVLLTDCDRAQAEAFLQRARAHVPDLFPAGAVGLAVFLEDGITVGALLETVRGQAADAAAS